MNKARLSVQQQLCRNRRPPKSGLIYIGATAEPGIVQNFNWRFKPGQSCDVEVSTDSWVLKMRRGGNHLKRNSKAFNLGRRVSQSRRQMIWDPDKWDELFRFPNGALCNEHRHSHVVTSKVLADIRLHHHDDSIERLFYDLDTEYQTSKRHKSKVFFIADSPPLLTSCDPDCNGQGGNRTNCACPCAPIGSCKARPPNIFIARKSYSGRKCDHCEFVVPGLKPVSDLGKHRSSMKYFWDRSTRNRRVCLEVVQLSEMMDIDHDGSEGCQRD